MYKRVILVVFDGLGIGSYIEGKSDNSFGNAVRSVGRDVCLPAFESLGLKSLCGLPCQRRVLHCRYGRTRQQSIFCDSFAAHWEMAGRVVNDGVCFSEGLPRAFMSKLERESGLRFAGNEPCYENVSMISSEVIGRHRESRLPIILTIPKYEPISTVGLVAFEDVIPFETIAECGQEIARVLSDEKDIGRVVVKTLVKEKGLVVEGKKRADYTLFSPPKGNLLYALQNKGVGVFTTGKISGLFNGQGITSSRGSWDNQIIFDETMEFISAKTEGLIWVNFNSLDRPYGHSRDVDKWIDTLVLYDDYLVKIRDSVSEGDLLIVTGDHGCDPTGLGVHTREWNPLLMYNLSFNSRMIGDHYHIDIGETVARAFGVVMDTGGRNLID